MRVATLTKDSFELRSKSTPRWRLVRVAAVAMAGRRGWMDKGAATAAKKRMKRGGRRRRWSKTRTRCTKMWRARDDDDGGGDRLHVRRAAVRRTHRASPRKIAGANSEAAAAMTAMADDGRRVAEGGGARAREKERDAIARPAYGRTSRRAGGRTGERASEAPMAAATAVMHEAIDARGRRSDGGRFCGVDLIHSLEASFFLLELVAS